VPQGLGQPRFSLSSLRAGDGFAAYESDNNFGIELTGQPHVRQNPVRGRLSHTLIRIRKAELIITERLPGADGHRRQVVRAQQRLQLLNIEQVRVTNSQLDTIKAQISHFTNVVR
jgi:hypothetical protein